MSDLAVAPKTIDASINVTAPISKPTRVPLKGLPPLAFQHPLEWGPYGPWERIKSVFERLLRPIVAPIVGSFRER